MPSPLDDPEGTTATTTAAPGKTKEPDLGSEAEMIKQELIGTATQLAAGVGGQIGRSIADAQGSDGFQMSDISQGFDKFGENFEDEVNKIKTQLETYNGLLINITNVGDLYKKYKLENIELFNELKEDTNDILTNERKTYYEEQNIDRLRFYYSYFMITIYVICLISFGIFSFMNPLKNIGWKGLLGAFIFLIVLPFFSTWILSWVIYLAYQIYYLIPKNVYK